MLFNTIEALIFLFDPYQILRAEIKEIILFGFWFKREQENLLLKFTDLYEKEMRTISTNLAKHQVYLTNFLNESYQS